MATKMKNKTNIIGFKELREHADKYISAVEQGRTFTVVRRSKPIFKMVPVDEWGDEGAWKTIADFTKLRKEGIRAEEVLASLRRIRKHEQAR